MKIYQQYIRILVLSGILGGVVRPILWAHGQQLREQQDSAVRLTIRLYESQTKRSMSGVRLIGEIGMPESKKEESVRTIQYAISNTQGEVVWTVSRKSSVIIYVQSSLYHADTVRCVVMRDTLLLLTLTPSDVTSRAVQVLSDKQSLSVGTRLSAEMNSADIERRRGQSFAEILQGISGVNLFQTGPSIAKPMIHGLHGQRIVVNNAGVNQEGQQWGEEHAPEIDPFSIAHVQVLRGAAGVQYGIGAIGGVIRTRLRDPIFDTTLYGKISINLFSNNRQIAGAGLLGGAWRSDTLSATRYAWTLQASGRMAGNAQTSSYILDNTGVREQSIQATMAMVTESTQYSFLFSRFATTLGIFSGAHIGNADDLARAIRRGRPQFDADFTYAIRLPRQEIAHYVALARAECSLQKTGLLTMQYAWQMNQRSEYDRFNFRLQDSQLVASLAPSNNLTLHTHTVDLALAHLPLAWLGATLTGTSGIQFMMQQNIRGGSIFLVPSYIAWTAGVFATEYLTFDNIQVSAGIRADMRNNDIAANIRRNVRDTTMSFHNLTGAVGIVWNLTSEQSLLANITSAWRPPSLNEQYSFDVHHGTAQFEIGDLRLQSEQAQTIDLAWRMNTGWCKAELSGYYTGIHNFINLIPTREFVVTVRGTFPSYRYVQQDIVMSGVDAGVEIDGDRWGLFRTNFAMIRAWNRLTNEPIIFMPADRISLSWQYPIGRSDLLPWLGEQAYIQGEIKGVGRQTRIPEQVDFADPPAGYVLVGVECGGVTRIHQRTMTWSIACTNLLNQDYREYLNRYRLFASDLGRNIIVRLSVDL